MRRKNLTILTVLAALIALPAAAETNLEEILATHLESKGGIEAIDAIQSMRIEGSITLGPGMVAPVLMELVRPNSMRMEFEFQGMKGIQAFDGETAWQVMPFAGVSEPQKVTGPEAEGFVDRADFDGPLINYADKGDTLEYLGSEEVEGAPMHKVKVRNKNGNETVYFLDAENCLEVKAQAKANIQGTELDIEINYGDYKSVAGVMMAHSITQGVAGAPSQSIVFEKIEANADIAADRFKMPAAKAEAAVGE